MFIIPIIIYPHNQKQVTHTLKINSRILKPSPFTQNTTLLIIVVCATNNNKEQISTLTLLINKRETCSSQKAIHMSSAR